jgi:hypothetical protein
MNCEKWIREQIRDRSVREPIVKDAATFSWQQFAVNISGESDAQLIERGFVPGLQRPAGVAASDRN